MDRARASSLESNKTVTERYGTYTSPINQSNKLSSLIRNQRDLSDDSASMDYYFNRDCQRPVLSNSELKNQLDLLQCTVNKMLNIGAFDEIDSSCHSVNISEALKHEYRQMMSALKDLENILSLKRNNIDNPNFSTSSANDSQTHQFQREIYYRDSLIKCLSDRLKVLCKANDKLIIDYENQENMLSEELLSLKRQLEKAKDAIRTLSIMKKRPTASTNQDVENELYYLRESLCNKEMMITDLKHRVERLNRENTDLKCELDNKEGLVSRGMSSQFERELSYFKHINEQMKGQIDVLNNSLNMKNQLINDLQNRLECNDEGDLIRDLREQCLMMSDENELHKEEILEQMEMLEDLRNQLDILSENTQFKDDTISDLKSCLRKLTNSISGASSRVEMGSQSVPANESRLSEIKSIETLLNAVKKHINQKNPDLLRLIKPEIDPYTTLYNFFIELADLNDKHSSTYNAIELFKEFLTNEINLKNKIGTFLTDSMHEKVDAIDKLQTHLNYLLSIDMDDGFNDDLRDYLHQCYLLDDNLRLVIEYFVKILNNIPMKSMRESDFKSITKSNMPSLLLHNESDGKLKLAEEEIRLMSTSYRNDKSQFLKELSDKVSELSDCHMKFKDISMENELLKADNQTMASKMKQMDRDLNLQTAELDNLEKSMRKLSNKFVNLSSANEDVKSNLETLKDAQIEKLSKELDSLMNIKKSNDELKKLYDGQTDQMSSLLKDADSLKQAVSDLKSKLSDETTEKNELKLKLTDEKRNSLELKARHSDNNRHLELGNKQLNEENQRLTEKLADCLEDKSKLEFKFNEIKFQINDQENSKSVRLQSDNYSLKLENKSLVMKSNSLESEKLSLDSQVRKLKGQLDEMTKNCADNHMDKMIWQRDSEDASMCKQKLVDLECVLSKMTEQLNEKARSLEEIRRMLKCQPLIDLKLDSKCDKSDKSDIQQMLLSHKNSEISYLKSKLESSQLRKSFPMNVTRSPSFENLLTTNSEISRLTHTIASLESNIVKLNQQLTDKSNTVSTLQSLIREKDCIIENASKVIKTKNDSLIETEKLMHLLSLQNTNIKDELSASYNGNIELKMLKSSDNNLKDEIQRLKMENENIKESYRNSLQVEQTRKAKSQSFDLLPQKPPHVVIRDNSVEQINQEIKKLCVNFEDKNNELKEYSLKEIKCRDIQLDNVNFELKLKTDQIQKILIENRRLSDLIEDESQRSSKYEHNLMLKEQLLQKLMKEKEKIRATFITELSDKNDEIKEKSKTVYFLNAELHRLSSDLEILNAELHTVKTSESFNVTQTRTIEIIQAELNQIKEENASLKFCVNLKMVENDALKSELTITQVGNEKLCSQVNVLKTEITEKANRLSQTCEENQSTKKLLSSIECETQHTIDKLQTQLNQIKYDYEKMYELKNKLEKAFCDLTNENICLKNVKETLENEKSCYIDEINQLNNKIDILSNDLSESKELICKASGKIEREKQKGRRLSDVMEMNEQSKMIKSNELDVALRQLDKLSDENEEYKNEIGRLRDIIAKFEDQDRINSENEIKMRLLEVENDGMMKELEKYQCLENQLNEHIQRKSMDNEYLSKEHEAMIKILDTYQQQIDAYENNDLLEQRSLKESSMKCEDLQTNLDEATNQLFVMEEKWSNCNNQWLDKYEQLRQNYETLEYDFMQQQQDNMNKCQEILCLSNKNQELSKECTNLEADNLELNRFKCEKDALQKYNLEMSSQIETLTTELVAAHTQIWNATLKLNENQTTISQLCSRINNKLTFDRRYGSQPLLNSDDPASCDYGYLQERDYNDLKNRYNALCNQIDNMINQLKKKDKRIIDLENENEINSFNSVNYEQMKYDYPALEMKYQHLKSEYCDITQQYRNHNEEHLLIQDHEVQAIQSCTDELQETILTQNQELDQLKSSHEMLANDYHGCCQRLKTLESQVELANLELGNWQNTYYNKAENVDHLKSEINNLQNRNENLLSMNDEMNHLKQELIDISGRMVEVMNCNMNLEQQTTNYRQKIINQKQTIEDLERQLSNLESYYECEVDQCRRDILVLKGNDRTYSTEVIDEINEKNNTIACLNDEIQCAQNEISTFNDQLNLQCERYEQLKQELDNQIRIKNELQQEYQDQCCNIEQLSAQLFDNRDLTERITNEKHRMTADIDDKQCRINILLEKLCERDNDIKNSLKDVVLLEKKLTAAEEVKRNLSNQVEDYAEELNRGSPDNLMNINKIRNDLANSYDIIERLNHDLTTLSVENEKVNKDLLENEKLLIEKDKQLRYCSNDLEVRHNEIQRLNHEIDHRTSVSAQELNQLKDASHKLSGELNYLHHKVYISSKSVETQTTSVRASTSLPFQSPTTNYLSADIKYFSNPNDRNDISHGSEATYSSSKSVSWKTTHTDKREETEDGVLALQQAIDDYNTLITDITVPENVEATSFETHSSEPERKTTSTKHTSLQYTAFNENLKINQSDVAEVIFVEVDEPFIQNISIQSNIEVASVYDIDNPKFVDIMQLLRKCNINVDYDQNKESPDAYFGRIMNRYKELEQFFVASMNIQFNHKLDEEDIDVFENFSENIEINREMLNEHCRQLNNMLLLNTVDMNNDIEETTAKSLTEKNIVSLIDIVKIRQMQSAALNVVFNNLQQVSPLNETKKVKGNITRLSLPYKTILEMKDICSPNIQTGTTSVSQLPLKQKRIQRQSVELNSPNVMVNNIQNDSYVESIQGKGSKKRISSKEVPKNIKLANSKSNEFRAVESKKIDSFEIPMQKMESKDTYRGSLRNVSVKETHSNKELIRLSNIIVSENVMVNDSYTQSIPNKHNMDNSVKLINSKQPSSTTEQSKSELIEFQATESIMRNSYDSSLRKVPKIDTSEISTKVTVQDQGYIDVVITLDNIQLSEGTNGIETSIEGIQIKQTFSELDSITDTKNIENSTESVKISIAVEINMNDINDIVEMNSMVNNEQKSISVVVKSVVNKSKSDQIYLQNISEGLSISEGKTKNIEQFEDSLSYASISNFEKAMHQLNDIDFENLDPSINIKDKIRIYAAEIDYLNEKNLFHTYAINVLTDPARFSYNSSFLNRVNESLFTKAKHLDILQTEFNFDPHISAKEKALISKVLESDYSYKQQLDDWIKLQKSLRITKPDSIQIDKLMAQLDECKSLNVKDLAVMEKALRDLQVQMKKVVNENDNLKEKIMTPEDQIEKLSILESNPSLGRQSKIPLLKGSTIIEGLSSNISKGISTTPLSNYDQNVQTISDNTATVLNKSDQLVTPSEVRLAIAGETSIDNLRRFANLLAEDNFDLASEIEKLLATIEELRRQLKENCEILSETVEMLQNSEIFVNDLERKLSVETKKTQIISNRVDKLNEVNKQLVIELQRILKESAPPATPDMDIQERCNYLLLCLKKLDIVNKSLEEANVQLQKQLETTKSSSAFCFLSSDLTGTIDFEFETTLLPNGTIIGDLSLTQSNDVTKKLSLTFEVHSNKDVLNQSVSNEGSKVTRFLIEQESVSKAINRSSMNKSENDIVSRFKNANNLDDFSSNNNCCCLRSYPLPSFSNISSLNTIHLNKLNLLKSIPHAKTLGFKNIRQYKDVKYHCHSLHNLSSHNEFKEYSHVFKDDIVSLIVRDCNNA